MKKLTLWFSIGFTIALLGNILFAVNNWQRNIVVSVPDGDSLQLKDGRRIRLLGIDAPEKGRCMADEARTRLSSLVLHKRITMTDTVSDDFGRILGNIRIGKTLASESIVRAGLARNRSSLSNPYHQVLKDAGEVAKLAKLGIWSDTCRGEKPVNDECTIKGNTRAGEKFYYLPSCRQYEQVLVDRAFGDAWFCSEKEAAKEGFIKASSCH